MAESHHTEDDDTPEGPSTDETTSGTRQRLRGIVNRFSGLKPNWNMRPNLSMRWPKTAEKETKVLVHVVNVGEGVAFLVEFQEEPGMLARVVGHTNKFYLIDGGDGSAESTANLQQCLELKGCLPTTPGKGQLLLNGIMITSPDVNHIAGVTKLLAHVKGNEWKCTTPILISERFLNTLPSHVVEFFQLMSTQLYKGLTFAPTPLQESADSDDIQDQSLHFHSPKDQAILCTQGTTKKPDVNWTNILETIQGRDFLLTSGLTYDQLTDGHKLKDREVKVFQVPHDGNDMTTDEWSSFYSTFRAKFYLVSGGERGMKKEILQGIIKANIQRGLPKPCTILVTNSRGLDAEKLSDIESEELEWYSNVKICHVNDLFQTDVALQSNQTQSSLPSPAVSTTVPQAPPPPYPSTDTPPGSNSSDENTPQHSPFNNTAGATTDHGALQIESQTEEDEGGSATTSVSETTPPQFITIDLKSGVMNPESILEWSPQTYIHLLRCCIDRGLTLVSGKPSHLFHYHGVVTIKKRNTGHYIGIKQDGLPKGYFVEKHLHVICTPVPHKPWNGTELNLCYVVQETIERTTIESFQKVLFLQTDDGDGEGEEVESSHYKMFGYDNNQWKIRHYKSQFVVKSVEQT